MVGLKNLFSDYNFLKNLNNCVNQKAFYKHYILITNFSETITLIGQKEN